ncbi:MAG: hypothetical protein LBJ41_05815 [Treponema sp.]|jgi:hypothetical protein|nr:hypothetical protein [Treponema sp.]
MDRATDLCEIAQENGFKWGFYCGDLYLFPETEAQKKAVVDYARLTKQLVLCGCFDNAFFVGNVLDYNPKYHRIVFKPKGNKVKKR